MLFYPLEIHYATKQWTVLFLFNSFQRMHRSFSCFIWKFHWWSLGIPVGIQSLNFYTSFTLFLHWFGVLYSSVLFVDRSEWCQKKKVVKKRTISNEMNRGQISYQVWLYHNSIFRTKAKDLYMYIALRSQRCATEATNIFYAFCCFLLVPNQCGVGFESER